MPRYQVMLNLGAAVASGSMASGSMAGRPMGKAG